MTSRAKLAKTESVAQDRRTALKVITGIFGGGAAAAVGIPALRAVLTPVFHDTVVGAVGFVKVGALDALPSDGTPVRVDVIVEGAQDAWTALPPTQVGAVWMQRKGDELLAFSTVCPHLGCGVDYDKANDSFTCPCHTSRFERGGGVADGPSPRALDELEARVVDGQIEVRYVRFKPGTPEKVPV